MIRTAALVIAIIASSACAPRWAQAPGLPASLASHDDGTIAGTWRARTASGTVELSILNGSVHTFAVQSGCTMTGGVLVPDGATYRVDRYDSGYSTDRCGPWTSGPAVAPFDGDRVTLVRKGLVLTATGGGTTLRMRRLTA